MKYQTLEDTVYFWFGSNDTSGSGGDGASPVYDVRLAGAAADAIPVLSGSATLLTHANYPAGSHEVAVAATNANGFSADSTYAVFCTLLVDSQNPTGFLGSFTLAPIIANVILIEGSDATDQIRDSVVDDATRIDASELNTLSGFAPASTIAAQTDVTGLNNVSTGNIQSYCDAAITANTIIDNILTDTNEVQGMLPSKSYLSGSTDADGGIDSTESNVIRDSVVDDSTKIDGSALNTLSGYAPGSTIAAASDVTSAESNIRGTDSDDLKDISDEIAAIAGDASEANQAIIIAHLTSIKDNNGGADFDSALHSLLAILNTGNTDWITSGGAGGSSTVTLTIDDGTNPIIGAAVQIFNNGDTAVVSYGTTNANGKIVLSADDSPAGTPYIVKLVKAGYSFDQESLTVSGNTAATYSGSTLTPDAPAASDVCRMYEYIKLQDGTYPSSVTANLFIKSVPYDDGTVLYSSVDDSGTYDSVTGLLYWDVIRGATVLISILDFGIDGSYTVPDQATARITDI